MTDGSIGRPEPLVRSAGVVERTGSATDRRKRRQNRQDLQQQEREQQERRDQDEANHKRRRLYDLLFDEIDELDTLNAGQRARIKQNLRAQLANRRPPPHLAPNLAQPPPDEDIERIAAALLEKAVAAHSVDHDHIVGMAAPTHPALPPGQTAENVALANQLRDCLEQRTTTSRRVAVYLRLLLTLEGAFRPHLVVDA
ncbi:hypothetical protein Sp245p_07565 [Azospirillum baldaniorum]|uniref:Uncharacterized protein n=1 Tax=Azospirillum baldaniorum TaxID=1064539 RepID=A0A9P1JRJ3_9PROT|nr:hypothetical protein [Azospirillum baldaniorum]AWJ90968.1 hypothetical protein Sp245p_07565 [Azospirillum baldaniorum]TWA76742.1 hypothetical protein FBZ85_108157 [Azospirillum brasilense]CCC98447.1 conserved protein of unknown function [Azospirillum baldaniorum]